MSSNTNTPAPVLNRNSSDDEISGLVTQLPRRNGRREAKRDGRDTTAQVSEPRTEQQLEMDFGVDEVPKGTRRGASTDTKNVGVDVSAEPEPEHLRALLDANPELRDAWREASAYRETFATPEEARAATALLGDLNRMDTLFYSRRPEDRAELAREVAKLDPDAFASLTRAMNALANDGARKQGDAAQPTSAQEGFSESTGQVQRSAQKQLQYQSQNQSQNQNQLPNQGRQRAREPARRPRRCNQSSRQWDLFTERLEQLDACNGCFHAGKLQRARRRRRNDRARD
jgi:hypothetical protein